MAIELLALSLVALWMGCDAFHMKLYKENRWKRPKIREVRYVTA